MMRKLFKRIIRLAIQRIGFDIVRHVKIEQNPIYPPYFSDEDIKICESVKSYTMTSPERIYALIKAVEYVINKEIGGAFVECGVWKGGSSMAMALTLLSNLDLKKETCISMTHFQA